MPYRKVKFNDIKLSFISLVSNLMFSFLFSGKMSEYKSRIFLLSTFRCLDQFFWFLLWSTYYSHQGRLQWPTLDLPVWRGIKGGKIFKIFQFFEIWKFYIFVFIPGSWGVHRYSWFQNMFIDMARVEVDTFTNMNCALFYRYPDSLELYFSCKVVIC